MWGLTLERVFLSFYQAFFGQGGDDCSLWGVTLKIGSLEFGEVRVELCIYNRFLLLKLVEQDT